MTRGLAAGVSAGVIGLALAVSATSASAQTSGWGGATQGYSGKASGLDLKETATEVRIQLAADVLFDFDKADILPKAEPALTHVAKVIREKARGQVRVEGHTDGKGAADYNQRLSERRAEAVKGWLVDHEGLRRVTFVTRGFGAERPVAPNAKPDGSDDPAGRQKNRRVEIIVGKQ